MINYQFSYRKWGNGSQNYSVSVMTDYCLVTNLKRYTPIGEVEKHGNDWYGYFDKKEFVAKSRKEVSTIMANYYHNNR